MNFNLKKPCADCPFLKDGAIELFEGRLESIIETLMDDRNHFLCHKTVHNEKTGGDWNEDEEGGYLPSGNESQCVGSMIYLLKANRANISMRLGFITQKLSFDDLLRQSDKIIEPKEGNE